MRSSEATVIAALVVALLALSSSAHAKPRAGDAQAFVTAHNVLREKHCAPPLRWSDKLASAAQRWADKLAQQGCRLEHSGGGTYGENLAAGTSDTLDAAQVVAMWYREVKDYAFRRGGFSMKTGHFTQVVWRDTREVGCGRGICAGLDVYVCQYGPPGNVEGQYAEQVRPVGCR